MKNIVLMLLFIIYFTNVIKSQAVTGRIVDENIDALAEVQLQLYAASKVYNTTSSSDGSFSFDIITDVEENKLPTGYLVSNNFPNPFNPRTKISITLPERKNVKVEVFNLLGQSVVKVIEQIYEAGTSYIELELNGLPNGFYISRITIDDKYTVVKKLMLIYGSQHLTTSGGVVNTGLNKSDNAYLETILDSLVATNVFIGRKTFTNLPVFVSDSLDLGNLTIERYCPGTPTVLYEGRTYHTVQIGSQCWLKENLNVGIMIQGFAEMTDNDTIEKYCYDNDSLNCETYGGLYKWPEAMKYNTTQGGQGICPPGWHLPALSEFQTLITTVNNNGNALKAIGQGSGSGAGTNISGFSALLAGARWENGFPSWFRYLHSYTYFWGSSRHTMIVYYLNDILLNIYVNFEYGNSVRCIKN